MFGYMTEKEAKAEGFTNHGAYYGIPCWIGDPYGECMVATKWAPMECLMSVFHCIEGLCHSIVGSEPSFMFTVKGEI